MLSDTPRKFLSPRQNAKPAFATSTHGFSCGVAKHLRRIADRLDPPPNVWDTFLVPTRDHGHIVMHRGRQSNA